MQVSRRTRCIADTLRTVSRFKVFETDRPLFAEHTTAHYVPAPLLDSPFLVALALTESCHMFVTVRGSPILFAYPPETERRQSTEWVT
jgi:hypothetical protein